MEDILQTILHWAIPFLCGGVATGCITYVEMRKCTDTALRDGVQCLLRSEIIRCHDKYIERGYSPTYAKEAVTRAYRAYHALGGNDVATDLYHRLMELPSEPPKE